jgi:hypothetical protein
LSGFIFEGSVRRTGAVTSSGLDATPDTAVVLVAKVLKGPEVLAGYAT